MNANCYDSHDDCDADNEGVKNSFNGDIVVMVGKARAMITVMIVTNSNHDMIRVIAKIRIRNSSQ